MLAVYCRQLVFLLFINTAQHCKYFVNQNLRDCTYILDFLMDQHTVSGEQDNQASTTQGNHTEKN